MRQDVKWVLENNNPTSSKDVLGQGEAAGQRNASSDSVHTAKYNSSLRDCLFLYGIVDESAFFHTNKGKNHVSATARCSFSWLLG